MSAFHELELLAAQAWLAAGDARRARAFARDLLENASVDDALRMHAHELLEAAGESSSAHLVPREPPACAVGILEGEPAAPIQPHAIVSVEPPGLGDGGRGPRATRRPRAARRGHDAGGRRHSPPSPRPVGDSNDVRAVRTQPAKLSHAIPRTSTRPGFPAAPTRPSSAMRTLPPGTSLPPYRLEPRGERAWTVPPPSEVELELAETLTLPSRRRGRSPGPRRDAAQRCGGASGLHLPRAAARARAPGALHHRGSHGRGGTRAGPALPARGVRGRPHPHPRRACAR